MTCQRCGAKLATAHFTGVVSATQQLLEVAPDGTAMHATLAALGACSWGCMAVLAACHAAQHEPHPDAAVLVVAERERQVNAEGWEPGHDDAYEPGVLAKAGAGYARWVAADADTRAAHPAPWDWPLPAEWWKPKGDLRDLVRGAALIAAEADRLVRAERAKATRW
jgi:hypothetical protein